MQRAWWPVIVALGALALASGACVAHEETTPAGYVIAPSVPADGGFVIDAAVSDSGG